MVGFIDRIGTEIMQGFSTYLLYYTHYYMNKIVYKRTICIQNCCMI